MYLQVEFFLIRFLYWNCEILHLNSIKVVEEKQVDFFYENATLLWKNGYK